MRPSILPALASCLLLLALACGGGGGGDTPAPPATPDFTLSMATGTLTVLPGQGGTVTVNATRAGGHASAITLSLVSPPAGITGSGTLSGSASSATFTVTVGAGAAPATYPLTLQGTDGTLTRSTSLSLVVAQPNNCIWRFTTAPAWFAIQDGTGPWTPVTGTSGSYAFAITQGRGGVAYAFESGTPGTTRVALTYGSLADLADHDLRTTQSDNLTVSGTYSGLGATETADLNLGFTGLAFADGSRGASGTWTMDYLDKGSQDLFGLVRGADKAPLRLAINRAVNVQAAGGLGAPGALDLGAATALTPQTLTLTGTGPAAGEILTVWQDFETDLGSLSLASTSPSGILTAPLYGVPASLRAANDRDSYTVRMGPDDGTGLIDARNNRTAWVFGTAPGDVTMAVPAAMTAPVVTIPALAPYVRIRTQWAFDATFNLAFTATFTQSSRTWTLEVWPGYASTLDLTLPDFSALAGWKASWGLLPGSAVSALFQGEGRTWTAWPPANGARSEQSLRSLVLNP